VTARRRAGRADEAGFTLVEVMLASTISAVITSVIATAVIVSLRNADATSNRLSVSHDAQIAQSWFTTDAQSADGADTDFSGTGTCGSSTPVLVLRWASRAAFPPNDYRVVTYGVNVDGPTGERQLVRESCQGTTGYASLALTETVVLAHDLLGTPVPTCTYGSAPVSDACVSDSPAHPFATVRVAATSQLVARDRTDTFGYTLTADRRSSQ
jgi:prepilin-type N-terminal cleavage/methylation domain-containing protein